MNYEQEVKKVYPEAELVGVRGLKLFIIEIRNGAGWVNGLAYNTSKAATWKSAYNELVKKGKIVKTTM